MNRSSHDGTNVLIFTDFLVCHCPCREHHGPSRHPPYWTPSDFTTSAYKSYSRFNAIVSRRETGKPTQLHLAESTLISRSGRELAKAGRRSQHMKGSSGCAKSQASSPDMPFAARFSHRCMAIFQTACEASVTCLLSSAVSEAFRSAYSLLHSVADPLPQDHRQEC